MAGSINKVTILGNLGADPETRMNQDGSKMVTFNIATSDTWNDKATGERRERTEWHRVVVFNDKLADIIEKYVRKGSKIYIEGSLQTRQWKDNNGVDRYTTEVVIQRYRGELVLIDNKGSGASNGGMDNQNYSQAPSNQSKGGGQSQGGNDFPLDDEIPF